MRIVHYRLKLRLENPLPEDLAYPLYAALLQQGDQGFAASAHLEAVTPVGQFLYGNIWSVSLLGEESIAALGPVLDAAKSFYLRRIQAPVEIAEKQVEQIESVEELLAQPALQRFTLALRTPVAFKSNGVYQLLPTQHLVLQSLISKWNGCFADDCPIEDEGSGLETLAAGLVYRGAELHTRDFSLKRAFIPGATGALDVENRLQGFHRLLAAALLRFGCFAGLGVKTALGMGGVELLPPLDHH